MDETKSRQQTDRVTTQNAATLLKVAQTMAKHGIAPYPRNYELFYEALSGHNPDLNRELAALGAHPAQSQLEQLGIRHNLPGHALLAAERTRNDALQMVLTVSRTLAENEARKQAFSGELQDFLALLETDPVVAMSEFASQAAQMRDSTEARLRDENRLRDAISDLRGDISRLQADIENSRKAATRDPATGLPNKAAFTTRLSNVFDDETGEGACLIAVSVEGLRQMAEHHGGAVAAKLLKRLATLFRKSIKKNDFVARIGIDEFAFIFDDVSAENAQAIASRMRQSVEELRIALPDRAFTTETLSLSAGIAMSPQATGAVDLHQQAELALRAVRSTGKPATLVFSAAIGGRREKTYTPSAA